MNSGVCFQSFIKWIHSGHWNTHIVPHSVLMLSMVVLKTILTFVLGPWHTWLQMIAAVVYPCILKSMISPSPVHSGLNLLFRTFWFFPTPLQSCLAFSLPPHSIPPLSNQPYSSEPFGFFSLPSSPPSCTVHTQLTLLSNLVLASSVISSQAVPKLVSFCLSCSFSSIKA